MYALNVAKNHNFLANSAHIKENENLPFSLICYSGIKKKYYFVLTFVVHAIYSPCNTAEPVNTNISYNNLIDPFPEHNNNMCSNQRHANSELYTLHFIICWNFFGSKKSLNFHFQHIAALTDRGDDATGTATLHALLCSSFNLSIKKILVLAF